STDLGGTILSWNAGAERMYGWTAQEAIGKPILLIVPEGETRELVEAADRLLRGESVERFQAGRMRKDGSILRVSLSISTIADPQGGIVAFSSIARDITELVLAQDRLRQAEERYRSLV